MVNAPRALLTTAPITTAALLLAAGCGGAASAPDRASSSAGGTASASSSPSPSSTQSSSPASSASGLSAAHPGHLVLVPADTLGRCPASRPTGVVCRQTTAYRFQPGAVRRVAVVRADAGQGASGQWTVEVDLDAAGTRTLRQVTTSASRTREFVLLMPSTRGPVITAAQVQAPVGGGKLQITGTGSRASAVEIVNQITRTAR
ncbi:hypothetical protein D9V37_19025 [Nocardioides mangrovicus]|uniref:SecDF P1 head subdomain domain-containing protein n=1 Tax=Nocardioides mangrovicus TaxID=2478913 RepID=A0A3L8P195_9ACTN|nr:hypothetical protein [Nocardioides mangrovicus]RLV48168.1 hypothetical protein D9V37_19025 [Nocardioides mangrovicus]